MTMDATAPPSPWVVRFAHLVQAGGADPAAEMRPVLDVACGGGRHTRLFLNLGHPVTAVDIDISRLDDIAGVHHLRLVRADLEGDAAVWPFTGRQFGGVVVTNYLYRPLLAAIVAAVAAGGVLIYETFAAGNDRFGPPRNPDFLLEEGELLRAVRGSLTVVAYEHGIVDQPKPAVMQRICAVRHPGPVRFCV